MGVRSPEQDTRTKRFSRFSGHGTPPPDGVLTEVLGLPCPECGSELELRWSGKYGRPFYGCKAWKGTGCKGSVGAYPDGLPVGAPDGPGTRRARKRAMAVFDRMWRFGAVSRNAAYQWLSETLPDLVSPEDGLLHTGMLDKVSCARVIEVSRARLVELGLPLSWTWPLACAKAGVPVLPHHGSFGARREFDTHSGVDLYAEVGTEVLAVENGTVIRVEPFTGVAAGSPWRNDTEAVVAEGISGCIVYGEILPLVKKGQSITAGGTIGYVRQARKIDKGLPLSMLHLELYEPYGFDGPVVWPLGQPSPPDGLRDPTPHLEVIP